MLHTVLLYVFLKLIFQSTPLQWMPQGQCISALGIAQPIHKRVANALVGATHNNIPLKPLKGYIQMDRGMENYSASQKSPFSYPSLLTHGFLLPLASSLAYTSTEGTRNVVESFPSHRTECAYQMLHTLLSASTWKLTASQVAYSYPSAQSKWKRVELPFALPMPTSRLTSKLHVSNQILHAPLSRMLTKLQHSALLKDTTDLPTQRFVALTQICTKKTMAICMCLQRQFSTAHPASNAIALLDNLSIRQKSLFLTASVIGLYFIGNFIIFIWEKSAERDRVQSALKEYYKHRENFINYGIDYDAEAYLNANRRI